MLPAERRETPCRAAAGLAGGVISDSYAFVPEDRPDALADSMRRFLESSKT
ncbi:MAG: hypothetical protein LC808_29010 [Actinobacteria bacterium]|nr:hypothetical protein [Actinomycetota bacterium]